MKDSKQIRKMEDSRKDSKQMDLFNELFTNTSDLKKLIDFAASKWELKVEEKIYTQDNEYIQDGFIADRHTNMLVTKQHIYCRVMPNKNGITEIHLIHDSQENTIGCQAYKNQRPVLNYSFFSRSSETANEFQNYIDSVVGLT